MATNTYQGDVTIERQTGRVWSLIIFVLLVIPVVSVALYPTPAARVALVILGIVAIITFAMSWSGFQYRFSNEGVEVRMLGLRLRAIPRSTILSYAIEPWAVIRGYGIRGIGGTRAYVWSNKVVHIKTSSGDVYLGHKDPERIIGDLDHMMGLVSRN
jgi:hypothetical protein